MGQEKSIWEVTSFRRRKAFDSPLQFWETAVAYFKWCDNNPLYKSEQLKKPDSPTILPGINGGEDRVIPGEKVIDIPLKRTYTKSGFCLFAGVAQNYLRNMRIKASGDNDNNEWLEVLEMIDDAIYTQQYEGGAAGQFAANIVIRGIGLVDKTEVKQHTTIVDEVFKIDGEEIRF